MLIWLAPATPRDRSAAEGLLTDPAGDPRLAEGGGASVPAEDDVALGLRLANIIWLAANPDPRD